MHPKQLEMDESQDYPEPGWVELGETLKYGNEDAIWRAHGVSRGVRDRFYKQTQEGSGWTVHRITAMHRDDWGAKERESKAELYGSRDHPDYRRNILGMHGDAQSALFVLSRLMACVDSVQSSDYNEHEYFHQRISDEKLKDSGLPIEAMLRFPGRHQAYGVTWAGVDFGLTNHPSEILVFAETSRTRSSTNPDPESSVLKLLTRVHLERISAPDQRRVIEAVYDHYRCKAISMDRTGLGLPIYQEIMSDGGASFQNSIRAYNFSEKVVVGYEHEEEDEERWWEESEPEEILANVLEYSSDMLRLLVDTSRLHLPWDVELIREFQGQTYQVSKSNTNPYGKKVFCADTETEVLTDIGWLTYDQLRPGMRVWSLDHETGKARWSECQAVHVFEDGPYEVVDMKGHSFSASTTMDHRWPVEWYRIKPAQGVRQWEPDWLDTRRALGVKGRARIRLAAEPVGLPTISSFSDEFVELLAWYWTEGTFGLYGSKSQPMITISQSWRVNPEKAKRLVACLERLAGPPGRVVDGATWSQRDAVDGEMCVVQLGSSLRDQLLMVCPDREKVVDPSFLASLTRQQLELFIETALIADGCASNQETDGYAHTQLSLGQKSKHRLDSFQMACALVGQATSQRPSTGKGGVFHHLTFRTSEGVYLNRLSHERRLVPIVWCPETETGTWMARREGIVHFTGNSQGSFHALDAARMAVLGFFQEQVGEYVGKDFEPVLDSFLT